MVYFCLVRYCKSTALKSTRSLTFHRVPTGYKRRKEWLEVCNRTDLIDKSWPFFKRKYVCSKHFEKTMYGKTYLHKFAIPTLYLTPTLLDSSTQTYNCIKFSNPNPSMASELTGTPDLINLELGENQTETERNDNPDTQMEVQSDELELKKKEELKTIECIQTFTDSEEESEEDTTEMSIDKFLLNCKVLKDKIRKEQKNKHVPQIPKFTIVAKTLQIDKETQTDDVAVFDIPKNNLCFQQCLRCGKNASWLALNTAKSTKFMPAYLITLDDFKRACEKYLSPSFCTVVKNQIELEQLLKDSVSKTPAPPNTICID
ncbi:hypothetical protein PYW07_003221 [Mythimna separata]|uniref:THAP-type domain-containing protein n=1 Tax=Mythimna separata TaxID=271217 RepID=A0AAD7YIB5_MYTSE|nr:hypothetical protein PYW07_003221 [Mythimna separata]